MKIAILTQPLKHNYGGMLQAFALQITLKKLGHDVITINRQPNKRPAYRKLLSYGKSIILKFLKRRKIARFNQEQQKIIYKNTLQFISQHITLSEAIDSNEKMEEYFSKYKFDAIIVGSDQTWRPIYSPNIYNFYLDFLQDNTTKRITYASSFGVDNWEYNEQQTQKCKQLAQKFNAISVREKHGVNLCKKHFNVESEHVLDPTLLLDSEEYLKILKIDSFSKNKGKLFTYILDKNEQKKSIIDFVSQKLGLLTFENQPKYNLGQSNEKNIENYTYPPVENWIRSFHDSAFVVTDSFHGCVFSIIFNKPFLAIGNTKRGYARFSSLLSIFNLENRLVRNIEDINEELISNDINWISVNRILEQERKKSNNFIIKNLV